jgi:cytochrome P450
LIPDILRIQKDPLAYMLASLRRYGDLVQFPIGLRQVYLVNTPSAIKHVLQDNHRNYSKDTIQYRQLATVTGRGLLTSDGELWLRQRRLTQPAFHQRRISAMEPIVQAATGAMLERWEAVAAAGAAFDAAGEMMRLTFEIIGKALFSIDLSREAGPLTQAVNVALDHIVHRASNFLALPDRFPTPRNLRFRRALRALDAAVADLIEARRHSARQPDDLLAMLMEARDEETGQPMSAAQARDEVLTLLIAGHETTASALAWTWHLLAGHPEAEQRLRAELATLNGRAPTAADLPALPYARQVFEETLRLYPPAWLITRKALDRDELDGHAIPAGSLIIISPYAIHRRPDIWEQPDAFRPERFDPRRSGGWPRFAYIPFGGGPRLCIGQGLALFEAHLILALSAQRFQLAPAPGHRVTPAALVTLRPRDGVWMTCRAPAREP